MLTSLMPTLPQTGVCQSCSTPLHQFQSHCSICGKARTSEIHLPFQPNFSGQPAPIFRRILACLLDYFIIGFWIFTLNKVFSFNHQKMLFWIDHFSENDFLVFLIPYLLTSILYFVIFHSFCMTSPGKWIYGITFSSPSSFLIFWRFLLREICFILLMVFFALPLLLIFFSRKKRGVHDWMSGFHLQIAKE